MAAPTNHFQISSVYKSERSDPQLHTPLFTLHTKKALPKKCFFSYAQMNQSIKYPVITAARVKGTPYFIKVVLLTS